MENVAKDLKLSAANLRVRLHRARKRCRNAWNKRGASAQSMDAWDCTFASESEGPNEGTRLDDRAFPSYGHESLGSVYRRKVSRRTHIPSLPRHPVTRDKDARFTSFGRKLHRSSASKADRGRFAPVCAITRHKSLKYFWQHQLPATRDGDEYSVAIGDGLQVEFCRLQPHVRPSRDVAIVP